MNPRPADNLPTPHQNKWLLSPCTQDMACLNNQNTYA